MGETTKRAAGIVKRAYLLAAVPHESRGEHHLLVHRLLCHGGRAALRSSVRRGRGAQSLIESKFPATKDSQKKPSIDSLDYLSTRRFHPQDHGPRSFD